MYDILKQALSAHKDIINGGTANAAGQEKNYIITRNWKYLLLSMCVYYF